MISAKSPVLVVVVVTVAVKTHYLITVFCVSGVFGYRLPRQRKA